MFAPWGWLKLVVFLLDFLWHERFIHNLQFFRRLACFEFVISLILKQFIKNLILLQLFQIRFNLALLQGIRRKALRDLLNVTTEYF